MRNDNATRVDEFFSPYCLKIYEVKEAGETRKKREAEKQRNRERDRARGLHTGTNCVMQAWRSIVWPAWTAGQLDSVILGIVCCPLQEFQFSSCRSSMRPAYENSRVFCLRQAKPSQAVACFYIYKPKAPRLLAAVCQLPWKRQINFMFFSYFSPIFQLLCH